MSLKRRVIEVSGLGTRVVFSAFGTDAAFDARTSGIETGVSVSIASVASGTVALDDSVVEGCVDSSVPLSFRFYISPCDPRHECTAYVGTEDALFQDQRALNAPANPPVTPHTEWESPAVR